MSDRKEKYISGILILLTLEIIFFPVLKISTWDVSLLKMLNMIYGKSNNIFAGSIQTALKQYMSSYIYMLFVLIILTIACWSFSMGDTFIVSLLYKNLQDRQLSLLLQLCCFECSKKKWI